MADTDRGPSSQRRPDPSGARRLPEPCPFVREPFPECHCSQMSSVKIPKAIYYCQEHFDACAIYRRRCAGKSQGDGPPTDRGGMS
jgi:hypothetical protein